MEDIVAIQQLLNQYSVGSSRRDLDAVVATYDVEGVWKVPSLKLAFEGQAAIREGLVGLTKHQEYLVQQNAPGVITVDGDTATALSSVCEHGKIVDNADAFEALGFYSDKLVRTAQGWRFKERSFELVTKRNVTLVGG